MNFSCFSLTFVLCIGSLYALKIDYGEEQIDCIKSCLSAGNRSCLQPPDRCGECIWLFKEINGICQSTKGLKYDDDENVEKVVVFKKEKSFVIEEEKTFESLETEKIENSGIDLVVDSNQGNGQQLQLQQQQNYDLEDSNTDIIIIAVIVAVAAAFLVGILVAVICWCKMKKSAKESSDYDYPIYGSTTIDQNRTQPSKSTTGDRKLAQSAQMYHFEHQKRQMLELEKSQSAVSKSGSGHSSGGDSADADDDDYTVYECPGLATTGDIEVPNPLFAEPPPLPHPPPPLVHADQPPPPPYPVPNGNGGHMPENLHHHMINGYKEP